ncbi:MAG: DAK2 domain-containing protein [Dehalococcoidia bacterium]|nr:DAK2 domain-containing protein [Dehalococcoidia bacterium]
MSEGDVTAHLVDSTPRLRAADLRAAFASAERWLATNRDGINAINVYPVPDGDTGTNMLLTLRAALRGVEELPPTVGETAQRIARAALLGARGNSGVILSQMLRGFAEAMEDREDTSGPGLVHALCAASDTAYASVSRPVEGTMLTVLREASSLARETLAREEGEAAMLRALIDEAYASVRHTPSLLPRLREAGVVDAGGAGVAVILEGLVGHIHGVPLPDLPRFDATRHITVDAVEHEGHGYCTEYLVIGEGLDLGRIERALTEAGGDSLLVVGDERTVHVHVHLDDPGPALSIGARAGALESVKVENMQAQHEAWLQGVARRDATDAAAREHATVPLGLVAIARGKGIVEAFQGLGATAVIEPTEDSKTSAGEILQAARRAGTSHAIVLPNDKDVFMAAETAARESEGFITVVPSANIAAGLSAAIYYRGEGDPAAVAEEMRDALSEVRCVEVSTASRDASVDGVAVRGGEAIAFVDGRLHTSMGAHDDALLAALGAVVTEASELVTVYLGAEHVPGAADRVTERIQAAFPQVEVEVIPGGQPHYVYVVAVE